MRFAELPPTRFAACTRAQAGAVCLVFAAATACALAVGLTRDTSPPRLTPPAEFAGDPLYQNDTLLYRRVVDRVRAGAAYHDAAAVELNRHGFRSDSLFRWRLPTYSWVVAAFPDPSWARATLAALSVAALVLVYGAERREAGVLPAGAAVFLALGVFLWWVAPDAVYWQEVWAATLIGLSVGALGVGRPGLGAAAGVSALCWRELALPYCLIAAGLAWWHGRRRELACWLVGLAGFGVLMGYHALEVSRRLGPRSGHPLGVSEWVRFEGLWFDLVALRTNLALAFAPGWVLALYLALGALGLAGWKGERGALVGLTCAAYLAAFSVVGTRYNFYWGGLIAPLLPLGVVRAPASARDLARALRSGRGARGPGRRPPSPSRPAPGRENDRAGAPPPRLGLDAAAPAGAQW